MHDVAGGFRWNDRDLGVEGIRRCNHVITKREERDWMLVYVLSFISSVLAKRNIYVSELQKFGPGCAYVPV